MVEMERAGLPTVSFTAAGFVKDARRSAQAFGLTALPIAVVPLPLTNQTPEEVRRAVDGCTDRGTGAPPEPRGTIGGARAAGPAAERLTIEGADTLDALDRMNGLFLERGWSDAFPLVPPTPDRVERMLGGTRRARDEVVAVLEPGFGVGTVEKIAINAVMAGCRPQHLPLLLPPLHAVADPRLLLP